MSQEHYTFADLEWQSRWNDLSKPHIELFRTGRRLIATGPMGVLRLDLEKPEDTGAVVQLLLQYATAIAAEQGRYTAISEEWDSYRGGHQHE